MKAAFAGIGIFLGVSIVGSMAIYGSAMSNVRNTASPDNWISAGIIAGMAIALTAFLAFKKRTMEENMWACLMAGSLFATIIVVLEAFWVITM